MRIVTLPARMNVARPAVGGDAQGDLVARGWVRVAWFGVAEVVVVPAWGDGGDCVVDGGPGFEAGLSGVGRVGGFGEGGKDLSWAMKEGLVSGDIPRMDVL